MCRIERFEKEISVPEYLEGYVEVEEFLEYCKACPNYGNLWTCPPYDFDVMEYWRKFSKLTVYASKIYFEPETTQEESMEIMYRVKDDRGEEYLYDRENFEIVEE